MTKRDEFGLKFFKIFSDGEVGYNCIRENGITDENSLLQFVNYLDIESTEFILQEINFYLDNSPNTNWTPYESMVLDQVDLVIDYPYLIIDEQPHIFSLSDIKLLLEEWIEFLQDQK